MHRKKGDTLIEVALAIGIFSMVAIVIVSVISASTSGAQSSLEVTLTREDLDSQAEALRFIHDSYVAGLQSKTTTDNSYAALWNGIANRAADNASTAGVFDKISSCSDLYDADGFIKNNNSKKPFIINTRKLSNPSDVSGIVVATKPTDSRGPFYPASTYPRILYGGSGIGSSSSDESLYSQIESASASIQRVEGIYIVGVKGDSKIITGTGGNAVSKTAYYDFYIRSCWMPPGADRASTVSTVIRLYDPAVITY